MTPPLIPPPHVFGFDQDKFPNWRPGQDESIERVLASTKRISVECLPTGAGKTLVGAAAARFKGRTLYLTRRLGLQKQIIEDFGRPVDWERGGKLAAFNVYGQAGYSCRLAREGMTVGLPLDTTVSEGPCQAGFNCHYKFGGCDYYDAKKAAGDEDLTSFVATNYTFWLYNHASEFDKFDLIICDEAHGLLDELTNFLGVQMSSDRFKEMGVLWPSHLGANIDAWMAWCRETAIPALEFYVENLEKQITEAQFGTATQQKRLMQKFRGYKRLLDSVERMTNLRGSWVASLSADLQTLKLSPVWPGEYIERFLFRGAKKILMLSATVRPKLLDLLGLGSQSTDPLKSYDFYEASSSFPVDRRPVIALDAPRMTFRSNEGDKRLWAQMIDSVIRQRQDRRILIHSHSYARRNDIINRSQFGWAMMRHDAGNVGEQVAQFKKKPLPQILNGGSTLEGEPVIMVSQSLNEGWDFPYDATETQIITKVPFPDTRDPVIKARQKDDPEYTNYVAMQNLVQMSGRGMRAVDDLCETLIIDGSTRWFLPKCQEFAPKWFLESLQSRRTIPLPLEKL